MPFPIVVDCQPAMAASPFPMPRISVWRDLPSGLWEFAVYDSTQEPAK